jgi:hypothetical protein
MLLDNLANLAAQVSGMPTQPAPASNELSGNSGQLPPLPPYDYYVTLGNGDDYGCWAAKTVRDYARAALQGAPHRSAQAVAWNEVDALLEECQRRHPHVNGTRDRIIEARKSIAASQPTTDLNG